MLAAMGERCRDYFEQADRLGGLVARMRLASLAQITSAEASTVEDRPEILERLEHVMTRLRSEFDGAAPPKSGAGAVVSARVGGADASTLRRHLSTHVDLLSQRSLFLGDVDATVRRVDEAASTALDVERVSVWFLDPARTKITSADLFERSKRAHSAGVELFAKDFEPYFRALSSERTIAAHDAHSDPRTSCFSASYLRPLGISSMLDVPIWVSGDMVGVVCHEHVGPKRTWNSDEETFAYLVSNFVAMALELRARKPR